MAIKQHAHWTSRWAFLLAAVGSAVGLGNIWKFPYEAGEGGGGAFVLIYLFFVFFIGVPVLITELSLGRRGQSSTVESMLNIIGEEGKPRFWVIIGWFGVIGAFLVLSFYSVIGGWTLAYIVKALGGFTGLGADDIAAQFNEFLANPIELSLWHAAFMALTIFIVARGVNQGLEKAVTFLMPALFSIMVVLVLYAAVAGAFLETLDFLFIPDFSALNAEVILQAMGQSFFSLSLGLGSIMIYGSYLDRKINIGQSALTIAAADSGVALMAGLAIFPIVFAYGLEPSGGPGLLFTTLPIAFGQMPFGPLIGALFFALLAVAAITSSISLLEPVVAYLNETRGIERIRSSIIGGSAIFLLGLLTVLSFNALSGVTFFKGTLFDNLDFLTNNILMPMSGMLMAVFVGWIIKRQSMIEELAMESHFFALWYFLIRFVSPVAIGLVMLELIFDIF